MERSPTPISGLATTNGSVEQRAAPMPRRSMTLTTRFAASFAGTNNGGYDKTQDISSSNGLLIEAVTSIVGDTGSLTYTGNTAGLKIKLIAETGTFAESGFAATFTTKHLVSVGARSFTFYNASFMIAVKLIAETGVYTATANDATFKTGCIQTRGTYTLTGKNASFAIGARTRS